MYGEFKINDQVYLSHHELYNEAQREAARAMYRGIKAGFVWLRGQWVICRRVLTDLTPPPTATA